MARTTPVKGDTMIHLVGLRELQRTMHRMSTEMTENTRKVSTMIATRALRDVEKNAAASRGGSQMMAAFKVYRDRVPKIGFPGGTRIAVSGAPKAGHFFYGLEFGGQGRASTMQFRPHLGKRGYFFHPTMRAKGEGYAGWFMFELYEIAKGEWTQGAAEARRATN